MIAFTGFLVCATIIFFAGKKLSYFGSVIANLSGLGNLWVGVVLLATVTSLPELMVGISSAAIVKSADLAVGDIFGSCAFNLGILALLDAFVPKHQPLFNAASPRHVMAAAMGIILICLAGAGLLLAPHILLIGWIGAISGIFILAYFVSMRLIYRFEARLPKILEHSEKNSSGQQRSLKSAIANFVVFSLVLVGAALALPYFAEQIAEKTGLGRSFVGTLFLAASTSLPEIAVSFAAIRVGFVDLAVGNLLGSNLFNVFILAIDDLFYTDGFILKDAAEAHIVSVLAVVIMNAIAIIGLTYRQEKKRFALAWDSMLIFCIYTLSLVLLYRLTS
jgi:cation:H+ antiporter